MKRSKRYCAEGARFRCENQGATLVEFSLLVTLIALLVILSIRELSWKISCTYAANGAAVSARVDPDTQFTIIDFGKCTNVAVPSSPDNVIPQYYAYCRAPATDFVSVIFKNFCLS